MRRVRAKTCGAMLLSEHKLRYYKPLMQGVQDATADTASAVFCSRHSVRLFCAMRDLNIMAIADTSTRAAAALLLAVACAPSVAAQDKPAAPAAPAAPETVAPPAWTVSANDVSSSVQISATAKGGKAQFVGGCSKSNEPGFVGAFSNYKGGGLRTDGEVEHVSVYLQGAEWQDLYSVRLQYVPASKSWQIAKPLAPVFLNSFSRGGTLAVVNSRNEELFTFDLTGSTAAVRTMRTVCGIPAANV